MAKSIGTCTMQNRFLLYMTVVAHILVYMVFKWDPLSHLQGREFNMRQHSNNFTCRCRESLRRIQTPFPKYEVETMQNTVPNNHLELMSAGNLIPGNNTQSLEEIGKHLNIRDPISKNVPEVDSLDSTAYKSVQITETTRGWYFKTHPKFTIYIHSAFYDDRKAGGTLPFLRIFAVADIKDSTQIYCSVMYRDSQPRYTIKATKRQGYHHKIDDRIYQYVKSGGTFREYVVNCRLPAIHRDPPSHVTVWTDVTKQFNLTVPVIIPEKPQTKLDIGLCVNVAYGHIDTATFVQWIAILKLFGVKEFNLYFAFMSNETRRLIDYYKTKSYVNYHDILTIFPVPPVVSTSKQYVRVNTLPTLNHCLLSNMYRYKYLVVNDFDEIIVPREHINYTQLIALLDREYRKSSSSWVSYTFRNVYYFRDLAPDKSQPEYLPMLRYRTKTKPSPYLKYPKSFINPQTCITIANHYCTKAFSGELITDVSPSIATSHHYRLCPFYLNCTDYFASTSQDDIVLRYKEQLIESTKPVLKDLSYF